MRRPARSQRQGRKPPLSVLCLLRPPDGAGIVLAGAFRQMGTLDELLGHPANEFVARFMGGQSLLAGQALGPGPHPGTTSVAMGDQHLSVPGRLTGKVRLFIRLVNAPAPGQSGPLRGT